MSQVLPTDFPIDPTTTDGVELADILNRFYQSTQSSNAGASAPSSTYAGQIWLDTSASANGVFKFRNAANSAWIAVGTNIQDGTAAAPSIAFANEIGLGWYRPGAGQIGIARGGSQRYLMSISAADTNYELIAGTGGSSIILTKNGATAANTIRGRLGANFQWELDLGNASGDFGLIRYNDAGAVLDTPIGVLRSNGIVMMPRGFDGGDAPAKFGGGFLAGNNGAGVNYFAWGSGGSGDWQWQWNGSTGNLAWVGGAQRTIFNINPNGDVACYGAVLMCQPVAGGYMAFRYDGGGWNYINMLGNNAAWSFAINRGNGQLSWLLGDSTQGAVWDGGGNYHIKGNGLKPGGGAWSDSSDERTKENVEDYTRGLDAVLALRPVTYNFRAETGRDVAQRFHGFIAQEAEGPMPEMVTSREGTLGELTFEDMRYLDTTPLVFALVNAVKELDSKIAALAAH